jgi:hypothetical protein
MRAKSLLLVIAGLLLPVIAWPAPPAGWSLAGNDPSSFQVSRDPTVNHEGQKSARLESIRLPKGFGTLMQSFDAKDYRGKRLRLKAWVKADDVHDWAGVWMRIDGSDMKSLGFDNMQNRPIKGTRDWMSHDVVLDVPEAATGIAFGILLSGEGKVWISGIHLDAVDKTVPVTSSVAAASSGPRNLDFEQ